MKYPLTILFIAIAALLPAAALERKPADKINPDELVAETQLDAAGSRDHIAFVWYIPLEYWQAALCRNTDLTPEEKQEILRTVSGLTIIAVVQGDCPQLGRIRYYDRNYLQETARFFRIDAAGEQHPLRPYQTVTEPVRLLVDSIAPALSTAIGGLGENLHFFVFNDQTIDRKRLLDPGLPGGLAVELSGKEGRKLRAEFEFPLNALYVPRQCPNGKPAHVSWRYCPWTGKKLPE